MSNNYNRKTVTVKTVISEVGCNTIQYKLKHENEINLSLTQKIVYFNKREGLNRGK